MNATEAGTLPRIVRIRGVAYELERLPVDPRAGADIAALYRLTKHDGEVYDITVRTSRVECDCGDFLFRRSGYDLLLCKHVRALRALGLCP